MYSKFVDSKLQLVIVKPEANGKEIKLQLALTEEHETLKSDETTKRGSSWSELS
jgi:hypothetical protein